MTIPVVAANTVAGEGRVYVTGITNAPEGTTDIVTLAYDFNLNLVWMKTYTHNAYEGYNGDDEPIAIATNQTGDPQNDPIQYDFVSVTGTSKDPNTNQDFVTLCYRRTDGSDVFKPKRYSSPLGRNDIPSDVICTWEGPPYFVVVTGQSYTPAFNQEAPHYFTIAYQIDDLDPNGGSTNGEVAAGWPRIYRGTFTPPQGTIDLGHHSIPVRMRYFKSQIYITGTTWIEIDDLNTGLQPDPADMLTIRYGVGGGTLPTAADQWNTTAQWNGGVKLADHAADIDANYSDANGTISVAVTGWSTHPSNGPTVASTMLYDVNLNRSWPRGARWSRPFDGGGGNDRGKSVRMVEAVNESLGNSMFNVYVGVASKGLVNTDMAVIKYFDTNSPDPSTFFQRDAWSNGNLRYYDFGGEDSPVQILAELQPNITPSVPRRIWTTGTSWGGVSAEDWATQYLVEVWQ